jgi:hypothetical protein
LTEIEREGIKVDTEYLKQIQEVATKDYEAYKQKVTKEIQIQLVTLFTVPFMGSEILSGCNTHEYQQ